MNLHRVRRLAEALVTSQLRSGRSSSDPKSWTGRVGVLAAVDLGLFVLAAGAVALVVPTLGLSSKTLAQATTLVAPFLPLVAVGAVLVVGVLFELTTTSRFSGSDAANWLPITPSEYVAASASAIAYSYSPAVALLLGALLPIAVMGHALGTFVLTFLLSGVGLFEGGVLVEMVRALVQRAGAPAPSHRGQLALVLRAVLLGVLILIMDLAFNPLVLLPVVEGFSANPILSAAIPVFWSSRALVLWGSGSVGLGLLYAVGQAGFVGLLLYLAAELRARFWVPMPLEPRISVPLSDRGHPLLRGLGLSPAEAAIASKDLRGLVRRRELLPMLVVPFVLVVLVFVEGPAFGVLGSILWAGWVGGFFSLLLATTAIGQERRSLQALYAFPISARSVLRAKAASVLVPATIGAVALSILVGTFVGFPLLDLLALVALVLAGTVLLAGWGLAFAARYSDFQERPRPQYLRPGAMLVALGTGMLLLFGVVYPGAAAILAGGATATAGALTAAALALGAGAAALHVARTGFDRLFRELPF